MPAIRSKHSLRGTLVLTCMISCLCFLLPLSAFAADGQSDKLHSIPTQGLQMWLPMDETAGEIAHDASGNEKHGSLINTPVWTSSGKYGGAISFARQNKQYMELSSGMTLPEDFTIGFWIYFPETATNADVIFSDSGSRQDINFYEGKLRLFAGDDMVVANTPVSTGVWTHFAITRSAEQLKLYMNGQLDAEGSWNGVFSPKAVGKSLSSGYLHGALDDLAIYNRALSHKEIQMLSSGIVTPQTTLTGPASALAGQEFQIEYGLSHVVQNVYAQDVTLTYDANLLDFVSAKSIKEGVSLLEAADHPNGKLRLIMASTGGSGFSGSDRLAELTFKAKHTLQTVSAQIAVTHASLGDRDGTETEADYASMIFEIKGGAPAIPGDFNNDTKVSIGDLALMVVHYGKNAESPDWDQARKFDMNHDSLIDVKDLAALAALILN